MKIKREYLELRDLLIKCSNSYYKDSVSLISDYEFDMKMKELEKLETELQIPLKERFSYKVGNDLVEDGTKIKHETPMLSLANTYNKDDVTKWYEDIGGGDVVVEAKIDGASFSATYKDGKLVKCVTRGDGEYGESILENAIYIKSLNNLPDLFTGEIRGELVFTKEGFKELNKDGKFSNPRNALSGSIKMLDHELFKNERAPYIIAVCYWLPKTTASTQYKDLQYLESLGLIVPHYEKASSADKMMDAIFNIENIKKTLDYEIDGAVMKLDDQSKWNELGYTSHNPRFATCYKYKQEAVKTKINDITIQIGRTGKATAVAELEPVEIDGSIVSRVTLNNPEYIKANDIRIGDYVDVIKSACIIPLITKVYKDERSWDSTEYHYPKVCPVCGKKLVKLNEEHSDIYCVNEECQARQVDRIINYCNSLDIQGFAEVVVEKLHSANLLNRIDDLYDLHNHKPEFCTLERCGEKQFNNLINEIEKSKSASFDKLIAGLGIPNVGPKMAKTLAKKFLNMKALEGATQQELEWTEDCGPITAEAIYKWFRQPANKNLLRLLESEGQNMSCETVEDKASVDLSGKTFCITGALSLTREKYIDLIEACGGKVVGSVSKKLSYLITNDKTTGTTKNLKAKELGIPILSEKELLKLCDAITLLKELEGE